MSGCKFEFDNGEICGDECFSSSGYCPSHYELVITGSTEESDKEDRSFNKALASIPPSVTTIEQLQMVMGIVIPQLAWKGIDPRISNALCRACLTQAKLIELAEINGKIKDIESMVAGDIRYASILDDED